MAFFDEILGQASPARHTGVDIALVSDASIEPVTVEEFKEAMSLPSGQTSQDADIAASIAAVRQYVEAFTGRELVTKTWKQTQNTIARSYRLYRRPVRAVVSVEYINDWDADTLVTVSSGLYTLAGEYVVSRSSWPSHRGFKSWITTFRTGPYDLTNPGDPDEVQAAREAVPANAKRAILQFLGHLYENREGQGPISKYEISQKASGNMPPNVATLLEPLRTWRFSL